MTPHIALAVNPAAGRGRAGRVAAEVRAALARYGEVEAIDAGSSGADTTTALAAAASERPDAVVVCGGDGAVHLAANVLAGTGIPLGIIPAGSGNDNADMLGVAADPVAAAHQLGAAVAAGSTDRIDVGRCDGPSLLPGVDRVFVGLLYAGFDAAVNERANAQTFFPAAARYNIALAIETLRLRTRPMTITIDGITHDRDTLLVAVGNGAQYGGGKRIAPGARWDDGLFEVAVIGKVSRLTLARLAPTLPRGGHVHHPAAAFQPAAEVGLASTRPTLAYADGEPIGPLPIRAWVDPQALTVLVP